MIKRHSILSSSGYDTDSDEDEAIEIIRRSSAAELVELWKGEYQATNAELSKVRDDFYDLKGRYSSKIKECREKDCEIEKLRQMVNNLDHKLTKEKNQTNYWFRKSADLENEFVEQKRRSTEILKNQHILDQSISNKYKEQTNKLEIDNTRLTSENARLENMLKSLLQNDEEYYNDVARKSKSKSINSSRKHKKSSSSSHFKCDTESTISKQRDPIYKTHKILEKKSEELRKLLREIEGDICDYNMRNVKEGNQILDKAKTARRQHRLLNACL